MPSWNEVYREIELAAKEAKAGFTVAAEQVLRSYLSELADYRERNIIVYFSTWLSRPGVMNSEINDSDMLGFMNAVYGLDKTKGLDIVFHTPGGSPLATEGIVKYLHKLFDNDINLIVPHMAMSAGTMFGCSCREIWMGKQSFLGPIDPQFSGVPAYKIKKEFEEAKRELTENPETFRIWQLRLAKYQRSFYYSVLDAIKLSSTLVKDWLTKYMFANEEDAAKKAEKITSRLNVNTGSHAKHFDAEDCRQIGLRIKDLESDNRLQGLVLSIYYCFTIIGGLVPICKIICNHKDKMYIVKAE